MMQGAKGVTMTRTSFVGARVTVRAPVAGRRACGGRTRRTVTSAKYGEEGKYFDLRPQGKRRRGPADHEGTRAKGTTTTTGLGTGLGVRSLRSRSPARGGRNREGEGSSRGGWAGRTMAA